MNLVSIGLGSPAKGSLRIVLYHLTTPIWFAETNWDEKGRLAGVPWCGVPGQERDNFVPRAVREESVPDSIKKLEEVIANPDKFPMVLIQASEPMHFELINKLMLTAGYRLHTNQHDDGIYHVTLVRDYS